MNESDMAMYDAFQKLLSEDGHLKQSDIFAFRLGWRECRAAQQSVQPTCSTCGAKLRSGDIWWNECEKCHSKIASG